MSKVTASEYLTTHSPSPLLVPAGGRSPGEHRGQELRRDRGRAPPGNRKYFIRIKIFSPRPAEPEPGDEQELGGAGDGAGGGGGGGGQAAAVAADQR